MKKIIFILIILVALGAFAWKHRQPNPALTNTHDADNGWLTYTDPEGVFSFEYPREFSVSGREAEVLAKVTVPRSYMPATNFVEAWLTVNWSNASSSVKNCSGTENTSDAAAGNRYDTTTHKKIYDGDCYTLEYTIHYGNIQNYDPNQGVTEFDEGKLKGELEKIVESFKYLVNSD